MNTPNEKPSPLELLRKLLKNLSLDWLSLTLDLAQYLHSFICRRPAGPYEILDYDATVELLEPKGKLALFKKRQRVKFLQNNIIAFEDYVWGDGDILTDYKCTPGIVVDKFKQSDRWNILISLRDTKSIGDIEQFHIEQKVHNTYLRDEEWLQAEIRRATRHLVMNVVFPKKRHCKHAILVQRSTNKSVELGTDHFDSLPDGRQLVSWETRHARAYEVYTLKWQW